jgi:hypothetical protein
MKKSKFFDSQIMEVLRTLAEPYVHLRVAENRYQLMRIW